jgi:hypothetical protein
LSHPGPQVPIDVIVVTSIRRMAIKVFCVVNKCIFIESDVNLFQK